MSSCSNNMYQFGEDGRGRLFVQDKGDHLNILTYTGKWTLENFFGACIDCSIAAGKPAVFRDELGIETWFHRENVTEERIQYRACQREARLAQAPLWARVQSLLHRYI